jgi:transketolase
MSLGKAKFDYTIPISGAELGAERVSFLKVLTRSARRTILQMLRTSQSGHPGGSLSCLDFLAVLYAFRITDTDEKIIVSNGHISPGVYSILAEMGVVDRSELVRSFRQVGSKFEGHITRHVRGVHFGTGPLGAGVSAAAGFAQAGKMSHSDQKVFALMGDGEAQEGQVHEMALFAAKQNLDNFVVFCDYNAVQLTRSLREIMPTNVAQIFRAHGWEVLEIDGHDQEAIWKAINAPQDRPRMIVGQTIMGYGVPMMEPDGKAHRPTWHGKAPKPEEIDAELLHPLLTLSSEEEAILEAFRKTRDFIPSKNHFETAHQLDNRVEVGTPIRYEPGTLVACREAYGRALLDLAQKNSRIVAGTADVGGSVMTKYVEAECPEQHIEFGICEQNMISVAGGLSLADQKAPWIPFVSTFGAFISSRAKDQARLNDINQTNVKMVATHCGLSVGEDGPTHQAIDDMGSFLGFFNTAVIEPADANHCDRIVRYVASHYGNFYVRMGRHSLPVLQKPDGSPLYDVDQPYVYGETTRLRVGDQLTIVASGPMVAPALSAVEETGIEAEIIIASSPKKFDQTLVDSLKKTGRVMVVEDHNGRSGFAAAVALFAVKEGIALRSFLDISPQEYQLSGTPDQLYAQAGIGQAAIAKKLRDLSIATGPKD